MFVKGNFLSQSVDIVAGLRLGQSSERWEQFAPLRLILLE
jgi:hypothetical protein